MSWRFLVVTLLLGIGAAAFGGLQLGDWLVQHAPQAAPPPASLTGDNDQPTLNADGKPYVAQPPQPRVDGTLGVPERTAETNWAIQPVSLFDTVKDNNVQLSRSAVTPGQAAEIAASSQTSVAGADDDAALDALSQAGFTPGQIQPSSRFGGAMVQSSEMPVVRSNNNGGAQAASGAWLTSLRGELAQCANQGFFERPSCAWNARNRYCGPNQAWGRVAECPQRP